MSHDTIWGLPGSSRGGRSPSGSLLVQERDWLTQKLEPPNSTPRTKLGLCCGCPDPRVPAPKRLRLSGYRRGARFQRLPRGYFGLAGTSATRSRARRVPPARRNPPPAGPAAHLPPAMACAAPATYSSTAETGQRERPPVRACPAPPPPPARTPALRPRGAPTFLPSRSLTWPSTSAASVIFCHGSRRPPRPLHAPGRPSPGSLSK